MQIIISGLFTGCIYGLAALGLVLIFKTTDVVNFAQGEMAMVSAFVGHVFLSQFHLPYLVSFFLALLFSAVFGIAVYYLFMKWVQTAPHLNQLILTLGLFLIFNGIAGLIWDYQPRSYPEAVAGNPIEIGNVFITPNEFFIVGITIFLMISFSIFFRFARIGLAMRASSQDMVSSKLMGINVTLVFMSTWAVGAVLGGVAGVLTAPVTFLSPNMMFSVLIMAFAAAVLGGFVSLPGTVIGGLMIGMFGNIVSYYIAPEWKLVYTFLLIITVLYIRPQGIFGGTKFVKKV